MDSWLIVALRPAEPVPHWRPTASATAGKEACQHGVIAPRTYWLRP